LSFSKKTFTKFNKLEFSKFITFLNNFIEIKIYLNDFEGRFFFQMTF